MGIKQYNRAIQRSYGPTHCEFHENCLSCPLSTCIEDMNEEDIQKLREERKDPEKRKPFIDQIHEPLQSRSTQTKAAQTKAAQTIADYMGLKSPISIYQRLKRIRMEPKDRSSQREMYINEKITVRNRKPASYSYRMRCPHCDGVVVYQMSDDDTRHYLQALLKRSLGDGIVRHSRHTSCGRDVWLIISVSSDLHLTAGLGVSPCDDQEMRKPEPHHKQQFLRVAGKEPAHESEKPDHQNHEVSQTNQRHQIGRTNAKQIRLRRRRLREVRTSPEAMQLGLYPTSRERNQPREHQET